MEAHASPLLLLGILEPAASDDSAVLLHVLCNTICRCWSRWAVLFPSHSFSRPAACCSFSFPGAARVGLDAESCGRPAYLGPRCPCFAGLFPRALPFCSAVLVILFGQLLTCVLDWTDRYLHIRVEES